MSRNVMIRCDADLGERHGSGHAMRCLALAQAMKDRDRNPIFIMAKSAEHISMRLHDEGILCILIYEKNDVGQTIGVTKSFGAHDIIVDSYELDERYRRILGGYGLNVIPIEDEGPPMFRRDMWDRYEFPFIVREEVKRVFVRVEAEFQPLVEDALELMGLEWVDPGGTEIIENMESCDVAISAGGITAWELAIVGVPSLLVIDAKEQTTNCVKLNMAGAALNLGWIHDMPLKRITDNLTTLLKLSRRQEMSFAGKRAVLGNGTEYYLKKLGEK